MLGGFDTTKYGTERLWASAPDGTRVPISLVYRKDLAKLDGSDPMLLDAYGRWAICVPCAVCFVWYAGRQRPHAAGRLGR